MAATIEVPGSFSFNGSEVKFLFKDGGRELDLGPLVHYEPGRQVLLAIMGVGIQDLTNSLQKPDMPNTDVDAGSDILQQSQEEMEAALGRANEFLKQAQASVESISK